MPTAKFINGQTLYFLPVLGCSESLILMAGQSLIAGFLCATSVLILATASPCRYPFSLLSNIFFHRFMLSSTDRLLQGHGSLSSMCFLKASESQVQMYIPPSFINSSAYL